jgi:hypothetical protein
MVRLENKSKVESGELTSPHIYTVMMTHML